MNTFHKLTLALTLLPVLASAVSLRPDTKEVASLLQTTNISQVGTEALVLQTHQAHPFSNYLIGIPVAVSTGSVCKTFVGQENTVGTNGVVSIRAVAATNPLVQACTMIFVTPIETQLTVSMKVLTGGFVAPQRIQKQTISIVGRGEFVVTLDMQTEKVTVAPRTFVK